jgi:hypothetical protein
MSTRPSLRSRTDNARQPGRIRLVFAATAVLVGAAIAYALTAGGHAGPQGDGTGITTVRWRHVVAAARRQTPTTTVTDRCMPSA